MPTYPSAEALLADAELRLDKFGRSLGILVVEGPDDKRFWCGRTSHRQQVIATGGRRLLLSARLVASARKEDDIVFLTDCDYEVTLGALSPDPSLLITTYSDLEADLLDLGGFEELVVNLVPSALNDDDELTRITLAIKERAIALAEPLGRIRLVAKRAGFQIDTGVRHQKYRRDGTSEVDVTKLTRVVVQNSPDCVMSAEEMYESVQSFEPHYKYCNGHDLVAAVAHVLRTDFGVREQTPESVALLLRTGIPADKIAQLDIVTRIRRWETRTGRKILTS